MTDGTRRSDHHDTFFHGTTSRREDATSMARSLIPASPAAEIDWTALQPVPTRFVSPEMHNRFSDVLYRTTSCRRRATPPVPVGFGTSGQASSSMREANSAPVRGSRAMTAMVSSPAMVPTM